MKNENCLEAKRPQKKEELPLTAIYLHHSCVYLTILPLFYALCVIF